MLDFNTRKEGTAIPHRPMLHIGRCTLAATMEFLSNKPLLITDTILRDAHQSQAATRMTTADMLPALEMLDSIGYYSLECWGGATFDACMRFLNEDPCAEKQRVL